MSLHTRSVRCLCGDVVWYAFLFIILIEMRARVAAGCSDLHNNICKLKILQKTQVKYARTTLKQFVVTLAVSTQSKCGLMHRIWL